MRRILRCLLVVCLLFNAGLYILAWIIHEELLGGLLRAGRNCNIAFFLLWLLMVFWQRKLGTSAGLRNPGIIVIAMSILSAVAAHIAEISF